jgi:alkylation response protein AidB-like acyl-CoA dehydrogenase
MDFSLNDEQQELQTLAKQVLSGDRASWKELASANLLGVAVPEQYGGLGYGIFEIGLILEEQGRAAVHLPILPTLVTALAIDRCGSDALKAQWLPGVAAGDVVLTAALETPVPAGGQANAVLIGDTLTSDVEFEEVEVTSGIPHAVLTGRGGEAMPGSGEFVRRHWTAALCSLQAGLADGALQITAEYTKGRKQFDKPIASFQAVGQRAADAYIDVQAVSLTARQATWRLSEGLPADDEIAIAKFWAAEGGQRVVHAAQHLHGGIGVDVDYPLHRYFTFSKQVELSLGGATQQLVTLGRSLAVQPG